MSFASRVLLTFSATCVLTASVAGAGGPLSRPTKQEARDHLDRGNRLYNTRSFDEAILEFKAGALIEPVPVFDYNLGQAYRQTGKYQEALWHYDRFLTYGRPTGELHDAVNAFMAEMKAHLENRALTMPPNAPAEPTAQPPPPQSEPATAGTQMSPARAALAPTAVIDDRSGPNWVGWGITGAGVAALGTGGAVLLSASNLDAQANANLDARARGSLHDQAHTRRIAGFVVGGSGLAITVAGVLDLVLSRPHQRTPNTASLDLGIVDHGVAVLGHF